MKAFLEEYGLVIVAVIVVSLLIVLAVYFGNTSRSNMQSTFDDFNGQSQKVVNSGLNTANDTLFQINAETNAKQAGEAAVHCTCPAGCVECTQGHYEDCHWDTASGKVGTSSGDCAKAYIAAYNNSLVKQWNDKYDTENGTSDTKYYGEPNSIGKPVAGTSATAPGQLTTTD